MRYSLNGFKIGAALMALAVTGVANESSAQDRNLGRIEAMNVEVGSDGKTAKKFEELLETKDLSKFRGYQSEEIPDGWQVKGKNLIFNGEGSGDIITKETYQDFELQVEWSVEKAGNSGIMFRVTLGDAQPYLSGPEIQVLDDDNAGDGKNPLTSAGSLYGLYPATDKKLNGIGKWNKSRIIVKGDSITHYLNGVKVFEAESGSDDWNERLAKSKFKSWEKFNQAEEGHIAFQNHGDPVKFRNIRIKRLDSAEDDQAEGDDEGAGADGESGAIDGAPGAIDGAPGAVNGPGAIPGRGAPAAGAPPAKGRRR